jgi:hypothetical protein
MPDDSMNLVWGPNVKDLDSFRSIERGHGRSNHAFPRFRRPIQHEKLMFLEHVQCFQVRVGLDKQRETGSPLVEVSFAATVDSRVNYLAEAERPSNCGNNRRNWGWRSSHSQTSLPSTIPKFPEKRALNAVVCSTSRLSDVSGRSVISR